MDEHERPKSLPRFAVNGILFNHESPRRGGRRQFGFQGRSGGTFVTKKVTANVAQVVAGTRSRILLGNLDSKRDWGHAKEGQKMRGMCSIMCMWPGLCEDDVDDVAV